VSEAAITQGLLLLMLCTRLNQTAPTWMEGTFSKGTFAPRSLRATIKGLWRTKLSTR